LAIGSSAEHHNHHQKRRLESESVDFDAIRDRKCRRLESQFYSQGDSNASKSSTSLQFEMLSALVQKIQEMNVQLGQLVADFAAKQDLGGDLVSISQIPCRLCHTHYGRRVQNDDLEESLTLDDNESQLP